jgi:hypothetical protein
MAHPANYEVGGRGRTRRCYMPKVLVCVFCSEEIEEKEKWLDVPGRINELAHLKCWKESNRPEVRSRST